MNKKTNIVQLNMINLKEIRKIMIKDLIINTKFGYYEKEKKKILGKFGNDFSQINAKWNSSRSANLFERIKKDPTEFALYHTYYRENRKTWTTNPLNEVINQNDVVVISYIPIVLYKRRT